MLYRFPRVFEKSDQVVMKSLTLLRSGLDFFLIIKQYLWGYHFYQ